MRSVLPFLILVPVFLSSSCLNTGSPKGWKYLYQNPPGKTAELFAPQMIKHIAHSSLTFVPNGKEMYWSTVSVDNKTRKIYYVKFEDKNWSEPMIVSFSGKYHDDQPFLSDDGNRLFFASNRPKSGGGDLENDIWITSRTENGWGEPKPIDNLIGFWTPSVTKEGTIYFLDLIQGYKGNCGIFRSRVERGRYLTPEILPPQINQKDSQDWCPFISPHEDYLIFSSDREGGFGSSDLYISFRTETGAWSEAINLGKSLTSSPP